MPTSIKSCWSNVACYIDCRDLQKEASFLFYIRGKEQYCFGWIFQRNSYKKYVSMIIILAMCIFLCNSGIVRLWIPLTCEPESQLILQQQGSKTKEPEFIFNVSQPTRACRNKKCWVSFLLRGTCTLHWLQLQIVRRRSIQRICAY